MILLAISSTSVTIQPGVLHSVPKGYAISNLDPNFNSTSNNQIYDPNFIPGFDAGLTNTSITWKSGAGYGTVGFAIGPWTHQESSSIPHFAVGPQCCNFVEIPHTQQYRRVEWGDYYHVQAGFGAPGVNVENYTTDFSAPADIGLRTDWDWRVQFSMNWKPPLMEDPANQWGAIGISITQFVPNVSGNLVSTLINFWMDQNSSNYVPLTSDGFSRQIGSNVVTYHPVQLSEHGNVTVTLDVSPFLQDTLNVLGIPNDQNQRPVISYVYLNVEGYNMAWNGTLWSFDVMSQMSQQVASLLANPFLPFTLALIVLLLVIPMGLLLTKKLRSPRN